ncbi:hypothetical protein [Paenibacillus sp. USDA918EY]|uniref:hypothetical protein n=1 Tax=Paenibacillus sp. USDA918EY TaxID=2689575 RepID=UPI0013598BE1|nr:hypothetical protein [Paenibacillus sp. USDA918EY]
MFETVECPYCEHDNDMSDALSEGVPSDNTFDHECEKCGKEFEVYVEFEPSYSASEIVYVDCERCGSSTRDPRKKGSIFPWPEAVEENVICKECFYKALSEEYSKTNVKA